MRNKKTITLLTAITILIATVNTSSLSPDYNGLTKLSPERYSVNATGYFSGRFINTLNNTITLKYASGNCTFNTPEQPISPNNYFDVTGECPIKGNVGDTYQINIALAYDTDQDNRTQQEWGLMRGVIEPTRERVSQTLETDLLKTVYGRVLEFLKALVGIRFEHPLVFLLVVPVMALLAFGVGFNMNRRKVLFLLTRFFIVILVLGAVASPYTMYGVDTVADVTSVSILVDGSTSMEPYHDKEYTAKKMQATLENVTLGLSGINKVDLNYFSSGNATALGDALYWSSIQSSNENNVIVLLSDGVNNYGRDPISVASMIAATNTTIYPVVTSIYDQDTAVVDILGSERTPVNADYEMTVQVNKTLTGKANYQLHLIVDGSEKESRTITQEEDTKLIGFSILFHDIGVHIIEAVAEPTQQDKFTLNNRFTKTVKVVDKPKILVITAQNQTPLTQVLGKIYDVKTTSRTGLDFRDYNAVYLDNVPAIIADNDATALREYVLNGNGLVVVGGNSSYDMGEYNNSLIEGLLPVKSLENPREKRKPISVVFLIDISASTEYSMAKDSKIDLEKAMAVNMIKNLNMNDSVGVIAFNTMSYLVAGMRPISEQREKVIDNILRLKFGGGTDILPALRTAETLLENEPNEKYVVILSDGVIQLSRYMLTEQQAKTLADKGVKIYTIGIGLDTNVPVLSRLATAGNGIFFKPEAYQRMNIEFGGAEEETEKENYALVAHNEYHFITQNLDLKYTYVKGYNSVIDKLNSQLLVTTKAGMPVLTVWRFGLGKVAAVTTDDGILWGSEFYGTNNGKLISALTNWVIGDMEKKKNVKIQTEDVYLGDKTPIYVESATQPQLFVQTPEGVTVELPVRTIGLNMYSGEFTPTSMGVHYVKAKTQYDEENNAFAVNYPREYAKIGLDLDTLVKLAEITGGNVYDSSETDKLGKQILTFTQEVSKRHLNKQQFIGKYFIILALALYFADTVLRRINEILMLKKL